jgi:hypothetical protein
MSQLFSLQNNFQGYLLSSECDIFNDVMETTTVSVDVRLSIYSEAYQSRLIEALATSYPVMRDYLGYDRFQMLGQQYLEKYPSHFRSIRWFGDCLEVFLKESELYSNFPYLSELAKVEWTMTLVFDAPDSHILTIDALSNIPPESWVDMQIHLHPSIYLMQFKWNVLPLWQAISQNQSPPELGQSESLVTWVFWRNNLINYYCSLADDEALAIGAVIKGYPFGEVCELLSESGSEQDIAMRAVSLLKGWIMSGLISEIKY